MRHIKITQLPRTVSVIKFIFLNGFSENGITKSFVEKPIVYLVYSRPCISGEEQTLSGECVRCPIGFYLIVPPIAQ